MQVGATDATLAFSPGSHRGQHDHRVPVQHRRWHHLGADVDGQSRSTVTGLADGTNYNLELEAVNGSGTGRTGGHFVHDDRSAFRADHHCRRFRRPTLSVTATHPASNGSPITDYDWSTDGGQDWYSEDSVGDPVPECGRNRRRAPSPRSSVDGTTGLVNGTAYPIELRAVNADGAGDGSAPLTGTPLTTPGAPPSSPEPTAWWPPISSLTVAFDPPGDDGGSAVTGYQYSTDAGATWHDRTDGQSATSTTMTITDLSADGTTALTDGDTYDVEMRAVNAAGDGPGSAVATGIPVERARRPVHHDGHPRERRAREWS